MPLNRKLTVKFSSQDEGSSDQKKVPSPPPESAIAITMKNDEDVRSVDSGQPLSEDNDVPARAPDVAVRISTSESPAADAARLSTPSDFESARENVDSDGDNNGDKDSEESCRSKALRVFGWTLAFAFCIGFGIGMAFI